MQDVQHAELKLNAQRRNRKRRASGQNPATRSAMIRYVLYLAQVSEYDEHIPGLAAHVCRGPAVLVWGHADKSASLQRRQAKIGHNHDGDDGSDADAFCNPSNISANCEKLFNIGEKRGPINADLYAIEGDHAYT